MVKIYKKIIRRTSNKFFSNSDPFNFQEFSSTFDPNSNQNKSERDQVMEFANEPNVEEEFCSLFDDRENSSLEYDHEELSDSQENHQKHL